MKEPYNVSRWKEHVLKNCKGSAPKILTLDTFVCNPSPKPPPESTTVKRPCPGLTATLDPKIGIYLESCMSEGGGSKSRQYFSEQMFDGKEWSELTEEEKRLVNTAHIQACTWRNVSEPTVMAIFACGENPCVHMLDVKESNTSDLQPCGNCWLVYRSRPFQNAISRKRAKPENLKYIPKSYTCPNLGRLYGKYRGIGELLQEAEDNKQGVMLRYVHHVLNDDFKNDEVFRGLVEAMVLAKERQLANKSMKNFKYTPAFDDFMHVLHDISPRAYKALGIHVKVRHQRSIKCVQLVIISSALDD
ncbi:hypothetical protein K435DRAFT_652934 [Dendrothele bispora CBS 962.96]|uniref:Uncharacterized protein n=1 Tax=Dendrothele bispora (strain CBS 962.96) TaxID=1314807 RepID=A0A4S8MJ52_DENBC|nr:hypothetical protein K435DRAFT_652934 [Dendrothele bispora CBS 962.96]